MPSPFTLPPADGFQGKLSDVAPRYVAEVRARLEERFWAGASGLETVTLFSDAIDDLIRFIVEVTTIRFERRYARGAHQRCAVIAQGGWGRREMNPWSDVDLLVLYPGRLGAYVETVNERLLYTLFDTGMEVGYATRTVRDCVDRAGTDLTIKTALLDGRFIAGTEELGTRFAEDVQEVLAKRDPGKFIEQKRQETLERHARMDGSVFVLEPNVKDGQGGLRDLHTLMWVARVKRGVRTLDELAGAEIASQAEQGQLVDARDFLLRVRSALHFLVGYKQDKLSFELQEAIAERFGYGADERNTAVELFMRDYYSKAAIVARTTADIVERLTAPPVPTGIISRLGSRSLGDGLAVTGGQLVAEERLFAEDPVNLLRIFAEAQRNDVSLSAATGESVRRSADLLDENVGDSEEAIGTFMSILKANDGVYRTLGEMNRLGVLGRMIPEFGRLFCMVQHDFYHTYTVDEHSLIGIRELERLRDGVFAEQSPLLSQVMRECDHPELLFLGMMFHDLGKGYGGDHDERGAVMVRDVAKRLKLHWDDRRSLEFLVRHHLLMSSLAQNRDVEDPKLVADFVRTVGTVNNLRNLYLLTFADMKAVGPKVWNGWKEQLVGDLYQRSMEAFETGTVTEHNLEARVERATRRILGKAGGEADRARMQAFLDVMPTSYLLANTVDSIIDQWRLYESLGTGLFRSGVTHFEERGFSELTVCAADQPGLFVALSGVLSAHRLNILSAKIDTSSNGVAIDTFRVDEAHEDVDPLKPELWACVRNDIEAVLGGKADVGEMVAAARRARPAPTSVRKARQRTVTRVSVDNEVSRDYTVIDVYAADRLGLLFTLADCIYRLGLTLHLAKIATRVNQVLDVFYVIDADGGKIVDPQRHEQIAELILERIGESDKQEVGGPSAAA